MELRDSGLLWDKVTNKNEMLAAKENALQSMRKKTDEGFSWMQNKILYL